MALFDWLKKPRNLTHFEDHYALNRESLYAALRDPIERCQNQSELVLLLAHFPDCFSQMAEMLEQWGINYQVVAKPLDAAWFEATTGADTVYLSLAEMLDYSPASVETRGMPTDDQLQIASIFVLERHPILAKDNRLAEFAKRIPNPVRLGYFLSLEDNVIQKMIHQHLRLLLSQMGLSDQELITSNMISRRLKKVLARQPQIENEHPADSAAQWYELNMSDDESI